MRIAVLLGLFFLNSCVSTQSDIESSAMSQGQESKKQDSIYVTSVGDQQKVERPVASDFSCVPFGKYIDSLPHYFQDRGIVVNNFMKICRTENGEDGYDKDSDWTLMGFPCTGGRGKMEWKGSALNPKLLIFEVTNACPMIEIDKSSIEAEINDAFGLSDKAKILAYYPFSPVFWELSDGSDADTSFTVEVETQSPAGKKRLLAFRSGRSIDVKLYGKVNAFLPARRWYEVDVGIYADGRSGFRIAVNQVRVLIRDDLLQLKKKCERLRPIRLCAQVFSGI